MQVPIEEQIRKQYYSSMHKFVNCEKIIDQIEMDKFRDYATQTKRI